MRSDVFTAAESGILSLSEFAYAVMLHSRPGRGVFPTRRLRTRLHIIWGEFKKKINVYTMYNFREFPLHFDNDIATWK